MYFEGFLLYESLFVGLFLEILCSSECGKPIPSQIPANFPRFGFTSPSLLISYFIVINPHIVNIYLPIDNIHLHNGLNTFIIFISSKLNYETKIFA